MNLNNLVPKKYRFSIKPELPTTNTKVISAQTKNSHYYDGGNFPKKVKSRYLPRLDNPT